MEYVDRPVREDGAPFAEAAGSRSRDARGIMTGILLGASFWAAILVFARVVITL